MTVDLECSAQSPTIETTRASDASVIAKPRWYLQEILYWTPMFFLSKILQNSRFSRKKINRGKKVAFSCLAWGWLLIGELCFPPQRLRMLHVQHWVASLLCAHWPLKFTVYSDYYIFLFFLLLYFHCPDLSWCTTLLNNVGMLYPLAHRRRWPVPRHCFGLSSSIHCDIYSYLCDSLRSMKRAKLVVTSHHITASATATASAVAAQLALRIRVLCYI